MSVFLWNRVCRSYSERSSFFFSCHHRRRCCRFSLLLALLKFLSCLCFVPLLLGLRFRLHQFCVMEMRLFRFAFVRLLFPLELYESVSTYTEGSRFLLPAPPSLLFHRLQEEWKICSLPFGRHHAAILMTATGRWTRWAMLFIIIIVFKRISVEYEIHRIFYSFIIVSNTFHVAVNALATAVVATVYIPGERRAHRRQNFQNGQTHLNGIRL